MENSSLKAIYKIFKQCNQEIATDTRNLKAGSLFFALKGEKFNGNEFAKSALLQGAAYVIIDEIPEFQYENCIVVNNVLKTLQDLAQFHRLQCNIPVIAIAGSNGKTTTKELIAEVLKKKYQTLATQGNFNNEIGLPLTLLQLKPETEIAVIEMGARYKNDIAFLCEIARPNFGLITNIGKDHLETFGSIENTLSSNAELYDFLKINNGTVFISDTQNDLIKKSEAIEKKVFYGYHAKNLKGTIQQNFPFLQLKVTLKNHDYLFTSQLVGQYNFENIMAAISIGNYFEININNIIDAIKNYKPSNNRSQIIKNGNNIFIADAYNANPSSMMEALNSLNAVEHTQKIVILGDMLELGKSSDEEHSLIAIQLRKMNLKHIILVGEQFAKVKDKLPCTHFYEVNELKKWFDLQNFQNSLILLKGSRKIALEKLIES